MPPTSLSKSNNGPFGVFDKKAWQSAARLELDGADPVEKLKSTVDSISIVPYYDATDRPKQKFQFPPSTNEFSEPRSWFNMPLVLVKDASLANKQALDALNSGADGLWFDLQSLPNPVALLHDIDLSACAMVFETSSSEFLSNYRRTAQIGNQNTDQIYGAVFWKDGRMPLEIEIADFAAWKQFHPLGIIANKQKTPQDEIADLMSQVVLYLDHLADNSLLVPTLQSFAFSVSATTDFFLNIAKLRALRSVWSRVVYGYHQIASFPAFIHVEISNGRGPEFPPHGEMLYHTTAALAAVIGGADAITVKPSAHGHMEERIARNVSSILREEAHLGKVADPAAGSYYLEALTQQIASMAWQKFLQLQG